MRKSLKLALILGIMLVAIFLFNMNTVNATEIADTKIQEIMDLIPNTMELDIPELEYGKAWEIVFTNIENILADNGIEYDGHNMTLKDDNSSSYIPYYGPLFGYVNGTDIFHTARLIRHYTDENGQYNSITVKEINIIYNDTKNHNSVDEQYVKSLKIESQKYYEINLKDYLELCKLEGNEFYNEMLNTIGKYYENVINDSSINVQALYMEANGGINLDASSIAIGIFKNGILYDTKKSNGRAYIVPSINVSSAMSEDEIYDYILNIDYFKTYYKNVFGDGTLSIIQGTKDVLGVDIPNGYSICYNGKANSSIIIIKEGLNITDNDTNIILKADAGVVPSDTILKVQAVKEGTDYNKVKTVLSNVKDFVVYDISLLSNGIEIQPKNGKVKISIPIPNNMDTSKLVVYRIDGNNKIKYNVTVETIDGVNYAQFETDHFSTYALVEKLASTTQEQEKAPTNNKGELDETPKTGTTDIIKYIVPVTIMSIVGIVALRKKKETK